MYMAALINVLDKFQTGENGHTEYGWAKVKNNSVKNDSVKNDSVKNAIVQLSFQLVRGGNLNSLAGKFKDILQILSCNINQDETAAVVAVVSESQEYLTIICKLVAQTRDIIDGKGEYSLSYMLIFELYQFFPKQAEIILSRFFNLSVEDEVVHPYGSWKDIKYFCKYVFDKQLNEKCQIGEFALNLMVEQLRKDELSNQSNQPISLVAKWCPREKCTKFGKFFSYMSKLYFKQYLDTATTPEKKVRAISKCNMEFRKVLSKLNHVLDTIQIKQCAGDWASINHSKTTSITSMKQRKALLNLDKKGSIRSFVEDRIDCAEKYKEYLESLIRDGKEVKGKRIGLNDFTVQAIKLNNDFTESAQLEKDILNSQWRDNASQTGPLGSIIPMVDVSDSMSGDPLHAAIALGIRVAEKSLLGKRVLTFSEKPDWHDLSSLSDFTDCVSSLQDAKWGMTTNFYEALQKILNAIIIGKLTSEQTEGMILAIFSDMQIDAAMPPPHTNESNKTNVTNSMKVLYEVMQEKYANAGMTLWGKPFSPPHILFWNLRSTSGFPVLTEQPNVTMFSGFSPALLNQFCNKGMDALKEVNPWTQLVESLDNPRYHF